MVVVLVARSRGGCVLNLRFALLQLALLRLLFLVALAELLLFFFLLLDVLDVLQDFVFVGFFDQAQYSLFAQALNLKK